MTVRRGEAHHRARLTPAKVRAMRRLHYTKGIGATCLARLYNVSPAAAWEAINYVTWKHVKDTFDIEETKK